MLADRVGGTACAALRPTAQPHRRSHPRPGRAGTGRGPPAPRHHALDVPAPLDQLLARLVSEDLPYQRRRLSTVEVMAVPRPRPGTSLSAPQLGQRLRRLGIEPAASASLRPRPPRRPPARRRARPRSWGSARLTAVRWAGAVGADWAAYAAQFTRARPRTAD